MGFPFYDIATVRTALTVTKKSKLTDQILDTNMKVRLTVEQWASVYSELKSSYVIRNNTI